MLHRLSDELRETCKLCFRRFQNYFKVFQGVSGSFRGILGNFSSFWVRFKEFQGFQRRIITFKVFQMGFRWFHRALDELKGVSR